MWGAGSLGKHIVGVYTRRGIGADVGGSTVGQQMRCAFEAPPLSPALTKPAIGRALQDRLTRISALGTERA
jgi:hypothetical protein